MISSQTIIQLARRSNLPQEQWDESDSSTSVSSIRTVDSTKSAWNFV